MVSDVVKILMDDFDKATFAVTFTECFDDLKGSDANFEMVASQTLQPVKMFYCHKLITDTRAVVFVNTKCTTVAYRGAEERGRKLHDLFKDVLKFSDVKVYTDQTKAEMIEVLDALRSHAEKFERTRGDTEILCVGVANVGFNLRHADAKHKAIMTGTMGYDLPYKAKDNSSHDLKYILTTEGHPLALAEYCYQIGAGDNTHMLELWDWDSGKPILVKDEHVPKEGFEFHELKVTGRPGRPRHS